jgi:hypothetical protein
MNRLSRDRNGTSIFAERSHKTLDFIAKRAAESHDVHPVTQAVLSLLGVIVFPWETSAFDVVTRRKLPVLSASGWPKWEMDGSRRVIELGELIHVLRNAIAHGRIEFDSDSRDPSAVTITFSNVPEGKKAPDWVGKIAGNHLIEFCCCFTAAMRDQVA